MRELVHQADVNVGVAHHVIEPLERDGVAASRLRVIYNGIDTERLGQGDARTLRHELGIPDSAFVAVSVGSLIHRKAHDVTVRAIAAARARGGDVRLLICGDGEEADALRQLIGQLGVGDAVHILGYRRDVGAVVRDAGDVCVTSAREETLGLNVLEAQWLGVPVIASDIPAHREALAAGVSGVLVPLEDPAAVASALVEFARSPAHRAALGAAGPALVTERFAMSAYVGGFERLYSELLARPRASYGWVRGASWPPLYTAWLTRNMRRRLRLRSRAATVPTGIAA